MKINRWCTWLCVMWECQQQFLVIGHKTAELFGFVMETLFIFHRVSALQFLTGIFSFVCVGSKLDFFTTRKL